MVLLDGAGDRAGRLRTRARARRRRGQPVAGHDLRADGLELAGWRALRGRPFHVDDVVVEHLPARFLGAQPGLLRGGVGRKHRAVGRDVQIRELGKLRVQELAPPEQDPGQQFVVREHHPIREYGLVCAVGGKQDLGGAVVGLPGSVRDLRHRGRHWDRRSVASEPKERLRRLGGLPAPASSRRAPPASPAPSRRSPRTRSRSFAARGSCRALGNTLTTCGDRWLWRSSTKRC